MAKIIKLNESDVERLVKKIIKEDESADMLPQVKRFFDKLQATSGVMAFLEKVQKGSPKVQAQAITLFAELVGVPKNKIQTIVGGLRDASSAEGSEGEPTDM